MTEFCCDVMKEVMERWDEPFSVPIRFNRETGELSTSEIGVRMMKMTPRGNISKQGGGVIMLEFCPFCGRRIGAKRKELPKSLPEKDEAVSAYHAKGQHYAPRWVYVHELQDMLAELLPDDWIEINLVKNLNVGRGEKHQFATLDLRWTNIVYWNKEEEE